MKKRNTYSIAILLLLSLQIAAQTSDKEKGLQKITIETVKAQMDFLASDWTEGRETGTKGIYMAGDYITSLLKIYGVKPAGDETTLIPNREERLRGKLPEKTRSYFQQIPLIESSPGETQQLKLISMDNGIKSSVSLGYKTDFNYVGVDCGLEFEAPVVFVGYGLQDNENGYDDFKGIDVKGKIIFRLNGFPGRLDTNSIAYKKFKPKDRTAIRSLNRKKNEIAEKLGAIGIIDYNPTDDPMLSWSGNIPFRFNTEYYEGDTEQETSYDTRLSLQGKEIGKNIVRITLSPRAISSLFKGTDINLINFEKMVQNQMKPMSKILTGKSLYMKTSMNSRIITCRNILGMIEGTNTDEYIVIGAHYDHLGKHNGVVWNGADDNASGTVGVMTIAKAFAESGIKPEKTIIFALWTGEEKGLLGSNYFVEKQLQKKEKIILNLNYDMISRDDMNDTSGIKCSMNYLEGYDKLVEIAKKNNIDFNLGLEVNYRKSAPGAGGGSDHAPFSREKIPFIYFMAGFPKEYHQPVDHSEKINWKKMTNIIKLGYLNIYDIAMSKNEIGK